MEVLLFLIYLHSFHHYEAVLGTKAFCKAKTLERKMIKKRQKTKAKITKARSG